MKDIVIQGTSIDPACVSAIATAARSENVHAQAQCVRLHAVQLEPRLWPVVQTIARDAGVDIAWVPSHSRLHDYAALFFDMDSTLVNSETLDEMAAIAGIGAQCAQITRDAMSGKISDYAQSLRARVALLKGHSADSIETVWNRMQLNPGARELVAAAHRAGCSTYITSSGFTVLTERVRARLAMTGTCANQIGIRDNRFTGEVTGPNDAVILDAAGKAAFVDQTTRALYCTPRDAVCFGDGSNDVRMIRNAGLGVGFRPKDVLRPHCNVVIDVLGLDSLLNVFEKDR